MAARRDDLDVDQIVKLYLAGKTVQEVATHFGVSRPTIMRRLGSAEVPLRSYSEGAAGRYARTTSEDRLQLTKAAHEAVRGTPHTPDHRRKVAVGRQANPPAMSVHEAAFADWLGERDIPYVRELAIDKYNVDFGIAPIAVEILGGEWHGTRKKAARHSGRTPHILDAGWSLLFVWATPTIPLTPAVADYAVAYLEAVRSDPSLLGEYRVIRGDAKLLARARAEDYETTGIPPSRKSSRVIG